MGGMRKASWVIGFRVLMIAVASWGITSCNESTVFPEDNYFPLREGVYQLYEVELTEYSAFEKPQSKRYQLRSEITDPFTDASGKKVYRMIRSTRNGTNDPWLPVAAWTIREESPYIVISEGNTSYARLIKPVRKNSTWNGNRFNSLPEEIYRIDALAGTFTTASGKIYANTVTVIQEDLNELTKTDQRKEVYAQDYGLVYKESKVVTYACSAGVCTGRIVGGYHEKLTLLEYRAD